MLRSGVPGGVSRGMWDGRMLRVLGWGGEGLKNVDVLARQWWAKSFLCRLELLMRFRVWLGR